MNGILYDARRIKAYEGFQALGKYAGKDTGWLEDLWTELVLDEDLPEGCIRELTEEEVNSLC